MHPRLFQVHTVEGSTFMVNFQPKLEDAGVWYGHLHLVGDSARYGYHLNVQATGCLPERGGEIRVSNKVIDEFDIGNGDLVHVYETETISEVIELVYPSS